MRAAYNGYVFDYEQIGSSAIATRDAADLPSRLITYFTDDELPMQSAHLVTNSNMGIVKVVVGFTL
jgi:hypothetical protein